MRIKHFIFRPNGRRVVQLTQDHTTLALDAAIPVAALAAWHRRLRADLARPLARQRRLRRQDQRRRFEPVRTHRRRVRTRRLVGVPLRLARQVVR